jgi:Dolichyl-phosphate-mannose-protein mannosyltransferase
VRLQQRRWHLRVFFICVVVVFVIYLNGVPRTPPGFCLDESSIAYNAHLVATTGHDEYREAWPLFFRAFGEYKNPIYIYLLALLFKFSGPSMAVARSLSAILGVISVLLIAYLATAISKREEVGIAVGLSTAFTPWLYENSRLVFEVALYPALVALFLISVFRASRQERWSSIDIASLAITLALLTYSYSIGRLLAPLFAFGLILFARRDAYRAILFTWAGYAVTLIPLLVFNGRHPGALTGRFEGLTYIRPGAGVVEIARQFIAHFVGNLSPVRLLLTGEDNPRDHLAGTGCILFATFLLALTGLFLIIRYQRTNRWWWYVIYAFVVSMIPAALTVSVFPQIRLIVMPLLINVLTVPAWKFLFEKYDVRHRSKPIIAISIGLTLVTAAQGIYFQRQYHKQAPSRGYVCDEKFPTKILAVALAALRSPIYLLDPPGRSGYVQSYWHGLLGGIDSSRFVRLPDEASPPAGSVVISSAEACANCRLLAKHLDFIVYTPLPSDIQPRYGPLPNEAFRAEIKLANKLPAFKISTGQEVTVLVKNVSSLSWPSVGANDGRYVMTVRSRWLKPDGTIMKDSTLGKPIFYGLDPGDVAGLTLLVDTPNVAGDYLLRIDVVQEGVSWFSDKGSPPLTIPVSVIP